MTMVIDHLNAAEIIARLIYNEDRRYALSDDEMTALQFAIKILRHVAKENTNLNQKQLIKERYDSLNRKDT